MLVMMEKSIWKNFKFNCKYKNKITMKKQRKQRLFEMMGKVDPSFKKKLNENWDSDNEYTNGEEVNETDVLNEDSSKSPINKFVYFGYNYHPDFIADVWSDNPNIIDHLQSKFDDYYNKVGSGAVMNKFYVNLDIENQRRLEEWVINNYHG